MKKIYEFITSRGILSDKHKEELKAKRGFSDKTIAENRFFSSGEYLLKLESELIAEFGEEECLESGICIFNGKTPTLSPMLLEDRIVIPYLDPEGKANFIRPHKLGLKNVPIEIYRPIGALDKSIIITEGEFKAAAAMQMGIPAIAIPGIGSFSDVHFPRLVKFLSDAHVRDVCIIFDNECKDNPRFKNYKDNPADRHDTEFYAQYMAKMLEKEGFRMQIGVLPDSWRVDGKADIDGALAQGKVKDDFALVLTSSKTWKQYIEDLPREAQAIIQRKMKRKYFRSHIRIEFGKYVATRHRGKTEWDDIISNFTMKIIATHQTSEGLIREIQFVNEFGETSLCFAIDPKDMGGAEGFTTFCYSHGNFIWRGMKDDLANIWEGLFLEDDGRHIIEPDHIGWVESEHMWLFGNIAIDKDAKELRPDKNHIFWLEKKGIKPIPLGITSGKTQISEGIPYISLAECDINEIRKRLSETIGELEAVKCLGWASAIPYLEDIFDVYGCYPFLFITGRTGSGKSTIAEWITCLFGIEDAGKSLSQTTVVAIQRALGYYSSLPVFLDEFRNTSDIAFKTGFLRNVYNRQSSGKGIKSNFGIREAKVRGTLIIAGEETPNDNAILNRSILIEIIKKNRTINHYDWFQRNKVKFSHHILEIIKNKKRDKDLFMRILAEARDYLVKSAGVDDRTAVNHAVLCAGHAVTFGEKDIKFADMIVEEAQRTNTAYVKDNLMSVFINDLQALVHKGEIRGEYWLIENGKIYLYFEGLYNLWAADARKRGIDPFKSSSVRGYFKEEPGFVDMSEKKRIGGFPRNCVVFDYKTCGENFRDLIDEKMGGVPVK
jgi:energy-coupling factor transporter ATP-binding protein EcfA2